MRKSVKLLVIPLLLLTGIILASNLNNSPVYVLVSKEIASSKNNNDNYTKMMDVLMSPRCVNCHPNDNIPKQGDDAHPHYFGMSRGENNLGYQATKCTTCHQSENNNYSGVPGAPGWSLAPESMKWEGVTRNEIAESMLDPKRNGGRNHEELMHHLTEHELVLWAWEPGIRADGTKRNPPPVPVDEYIKAVKQWFKDGAIIPSNP
ncbi:hypothetical protein BTO06_07275 [Tenacibaculum sp. SZ-18]|uniref:hypothetical protein n=1 Tax=Tenacibaculum sp. SZ-18 TaxID=754423 RepID=UPI000C2D407D|nr:hypothetical protein [Tenacibaculum sp. SZ-18]AUC14948.1 hypothetical protein BTO06_07275 [Tenacibaculum sp. SZ-18]